MRGNAFPPHALRDYAFLGDGYRGALVGPRGDVSWMCAPTWDSPAVFAQLLGGQGIYAVVPRETFVWGGYYEPQSLVWRSRWTTTSGRAESREALAVPSDPHRAVLLRRVEALDGEIELDVVLRLAADFGRADSTVTRSDDGTWIVETGGLQARWSGGGKARLDGHGELHLRLHLRAGERHDFILEVSDRALPDPTDCDVAWSAIEAHWHGAVPAFEDAVGRRDVQHSYAVLRGLTAPGGGMVAAATLGLPERARAGRNYDYRYVWLRDQAYAGLAVGALAPDPLLDEAVAVSTARVLEHGSRLAPAYRLDGRLPPKEEHLDLPGYPGGRVVTGNWVRRQFQLDACGELLQLYACQGGHDRLTSDDVRAVSTLVDVVDGRWERPEAGVWELDDDWWTHSRLSCVAGLRAVAEHMAKDEVTRVATLADRILAETSTRCLNDDGSWRQAPDRPGVDASLLLPPVRGAVPAGDPRTAATRDAVRRDLVQDGYVYRYAADGLPLGDAEGAFLMCGFLLSLAELHAGDHVEAFRWFERQRAASGPPGLLSEEFDVRQRQLRGNAPQAFVHALLIECGQRLGASGSGRGAA